MSVASVTRTERDAAARTALAALAALAEQSHRGFNPRLACGAAPVASTLAAAQRDRDVEATSAGCRLLFAVASGDDPGNVPGESTAAFAACLADACDEAASIHLSSDPSDPSGGCDVTVTEEGERARAAALAAAALAGFLRGWGGRDLDGDVAARAFARSSPTWRVTFGSLRGNPELDPPGRLVTLVTLVTRYPRLAAAGFSVAFGGASAPPSPRGSHRVRSIARDGGAAVGECAAWSPGSRADVRGDASALTVRRSGAR